MDNNHRPVPQFIRTNSRLVSKKTLRSTPHNKKIPPRPPSKTLAPISRFFSQPSLTKAQAISFVENSNSSTLSKHYDESRDESYFHQCFDLIGKIGSGSFGDVFKVRSKEDGRYYAIKKSRERFKGKSDRERKLGEVAKHERLPKHPNLVRFYKAWEEKQFLYIQTELCQTNLTEYLELHHDLSEDIVWNFLIDLLSALKHLHDHNLIHLDVKPDNIFISNDGVCKLGDFGLVVDFSKGEVDEATEGDPKYLAKELMQGIFTKAADIFSLGLTALEIACDVDLPSGGQGWHQLRNGQIPGELLNDLSPDLRNIIESMLHPNHELRPTAQQLLNQPTIKKTALWRKWRLRCRRAYSSMTLFFNRFLSLIFNLLYLSVVYRWFLSFYHRRRRNDSNTPPNQNTVETLQRISSSDWDNSFSDDDVMESTIFSGRLNDTNRFTPSSDELSLNSSFSPRALSTNSMRRHRQLFDDSPGVTPIRKDVSFFQDSPSAFRDTFTLSKAGLSQRLSFCDISDDENDDMNVSTQSNIGPKNLLSVFEAIESQEKTKRPNVTEEI